MKKQTPHKPNVPKQPTSELAKANNQIHILQTTVAELNAQLATAKTAVERRDRMIAEEVARSKKFDVALSEARVELATLRSKWYVRLFGRG